MAFGPTWRHVVDRRCAHRGSAPTPTFGPITWQAAYTRPVLIKMIEHHLHRTLALLDRVVLRHDPHPPHRRKRHQTRNGSGG